MSIKNTGQDPNSPVHLKQMIVLDIYILHFFKTILKGANKAAYTI